MRGARGGGILAVVMLQSALSTLFWGFLIASSLALFPLACLIWLLSAPFDRRRRLLHQFTCFWASLYTWLNPAWPVHIEGREKIRREGTYVMVANHQSLLDILVLFRSAPRFSPARPGWSRCRARPRSR